MNRLSSEATLSFDKVHLLLKLLLVVEGDLVGGEFIVGPATEVGRLVDFLRSIIELGTTISSVHLRKHAEAGHYSVRTDSWNGAHREPIVGPVSVHGDMALDCFAHLRVPDTNAFQVLAFELFLHRLHNEPDLGLPLDAHVTELNLDAHIY